MSSQVILSGHWQKTETHGCLIGFGPMLVGYTFFFDLVFDGVCRISLRVIFRLVAIYFSKEWLKIIHQMPKNIGGINGLNEIVSNI